MKREKEGKVAVRRERRPGVWLAGKLALSWATGLEGSEPGGKVYELEAYEVVTTGTRTERLAKETPIRTELIPAEILRSAGVADLAGALAYMPGARVEANCQNCGTTEVKLLGLGAGYNQLLFDGQPLFSGLAAVYGLEHVPTAFVERIEVVKGGASSLYGPGAVAGVVNIIPREPLFNQVQVEGSVEEMAGAAGQGVTGVWDWAPRGTRQALTIYGEHREVEAMDIDGDGFSETPKKRFFTTGSNFWMYPAKAARISGNYAYTWEERRGGDSPELLPHEAQIAEQLEHRWHRGGLFWEQGTGKDLTIRLGGSLSHMERDSYYGGVGDMSLPGQAGHDPEAYLAAVEDAKLLYGYTKSIRTYLDSLVTLRQGHHTISLGAQYKLDDVLDEKRNEAGASLRTDGIPAARRGEDPIADDAFENIGFFIQDEWDPNANWTLIGGLRADRHSQLEQWILSPRLAARYTASSQLILRGSISTGFRAPEIFDEDFHIEILDDPTRKRNAEGLREESSRSVAGGIVWTPAFAEGRLQVDVEFHQTRISDTFNVPDVVLTDENGNAFKLRQNAGGSTVQGAEANLLYRPIESLTLEAGLSFNDATFDEPQEVIPGILERRYIESPRWSGVARLNYENEELFDVFLGLVYTGPMIAVNEAEAFLNPDTGHFLVVDFSIKRHLEFGSGERPLHWDLTIGVRNLFDARQKDLPSGPNRDPGYFYGPRFPRSYFLSLSCRY